MLEKKVSSASSFSKHGLLSSQTQLFQSLTAASQLSKISRDGDRTISLGRLLYFLTTATVSKFFSLNPVRMKSFLCLLFLILPPCSGGYVLLMTSLWVLGSCCYIPPKPPKSKDEITLSIPYPHCDTTPKG